MTNISYRLRKRTSRTLAKEQRRKDRMHTREHCATIVRARRCYRITATGQKCLPKAL